MNLDYDVIIIGGGATGLGTAVEAATRGYKTLLLEGYDYGKGTSSKSTKLIHGGLRYLANMDFALVKEGLEERYYFLNNAPHLAKPQTYMIPLRNTKEKIKYTIGTKIYDALGGKLAIGKSKNFSTKDTLSDAPDFKQDKLIGSIVYHDGQFDDTRMLISLLKTFIANGGTAHNYHRVTKIEPNTPHGYTVSGTNLLTHEPFSFTSKYVINATGTFNDYTEELSTHHKKDLVASAQGTHLVFDKKFFDTKHAILIPETEDGRVLFILPWHDKIVVGTTDVKVDKPSLEPQAQKEEIHFIIDTFNQYSKHPVTTNDVLSVFCGQRPLVKDKESNNTAKISRKHIVYANHQTNLINIVGGKWTIYRRMGQDTIDFMEKYFSLNKTKSITKNYPLIDALAHPQNDLQERYGNQATEVIKLQQELNNFARLHNGLPYYEAEVIYQIRHEQAQTIEDILCRRTRAMFLNSKAALESSAKIAQIIAQECGHNNDWIKAQELHIHNLAKCYMVQSIV